MYRQKGTQKTLQNIIDEIVKIHQSGASISCLAAEYGKPFKTVKNMCERKKEGTAVACSEKHMEQADIYSKYRGKKTLSEADQILFTAAVTYLKGVMNGKTTIPTNDWRGDRMPRWKELKRFCENDGRELYKDTDHYYYRKREWDGTTRFTKVSKGSGEIHSAM